VLHFGDICYLHPQSNYEELVFIFVKK